MAYNKQKLNKAGLTEEEFLKQYNPGKYERPSVTVDMMILRMKKKLDGLKLLLIQRKDHPCIDQWALAGGFVDITESAYNAACRELQEETGLTDVYLEQLYTMSQPDRDPRMRVIDIAYIALLPYNKSSEVKAGDDAKDALWFDVKLTDSELILSNNERNIEIKYTLINKTFKNGVISIDNYVPQLASEEALAFDHAEIILEGLFRLRNKIEYTDIAFNLVPEEFTLPDLQKVYEVILGKELYKANFRNKINDKIIELNKVGKPLSSVRSSTLYKYKA